MATIYTQNWVDGNSTFTSVYDYNRIINGADALYPEMEDAEGVTVTGSGLEFNETHRGAFATWLQAGIQLQGFPVFDGSVGSITGTYTPTTASLDDLAGAAANLIEVRNDYAPNPFVANILANDLGGGSWQLELQYQSWSGYPTVTATMPTPAVGVAETWKLCWKSATPIGDWSDLESDGYIRAYRNGVLVAEAVDVQFYVGGATLNNHVEEVRFGFASMLGTLTNIVFSDSACSTALRANHFIGEGVTQQGITLAVTMGLDGSTHTCTRPNACTIYGDLVVTGEIVGGGATVSPGDLSTQLDALGT